MHYEQARGKQRGRRRRNVHPPASVQQLRIGAGTGRTGEAAHHLAFAPRAPDVVECVLYGTGGEGALVEILDALLELAVRVAAVGKFAVVHVEVFEPPGAVAPAKQGAKGRGRCDLWLKLRGLGVRPPPQEEGGRALFGVREAPVAIGGHGSTHNAGLGGWGDE